MKIEELGEMSSRELIKTVGSQAVIPVLTIKEIKDAVPLASALVKGGLLVLEVALRTPQSLEAVRLINEEVPSALVGVGTVLEPYQFQKSREAGALFAVSPGMDPYLFDAASDTQLPWLPGVETATEATVANRFHFTTLKHFPANEGWLKAIRGPFPDLRFCVTGGVEMRTAPSWLKKPNVWAVGGGWVADEFVEGKRWRELEKRAVIVSQMKRD